MDTTKLTVGQDVYVVSNKGFYFSQGKVTNITPEGVEVLTGIAVPVEQLSQYVYDERDLDLRTWSPMWFDSNGKNGTDGNDGWDVMGFGPWHIDDMPFAERRNHRKNMHINPNPEVHTEEDQQALVIGRGGEGVRLEVLSAKDRQRRRAAVAALRVGQDVALDAGVYGLDGKVVKIRWWGVYVQTYGSISSRIPSRLLRFNKDGELVGGDPRFLPLPLEGGRWYINPLPEGLQAKHEQMHEQTMREHQSFITWWKSASYEKRLALVTKYYMTRLAPPLRANFAPAEEVARIADISSDGFLLVELAKESFE